MSKACAPNAPGSTYAASSVVTAATIRGSSVTAGETDVTALNVSGWPSRLARPAAVLHAAEHHLAVLDATNSVLHR